MSETPASPPTAFHVMAKPTGARCNLNCAYCFFLRKERLYPGGTFRMSEEVLEAYIRQTLDGRRGPAVTFAWQGGEPTLMGVDFYRRAVELQRRHARPGVTIENAFQTNGVLIDEEWCEFLRENRFLVGLSLDGPREVHDAYRRDKAGRSVFDQVVRAARLMRERRVEFNILCAVHAANARRALEVYRFFRDDIRAAYLQFIPIVERASEADGQACEDLSLDLPLGPPSNSSRAHGPGAFPEPPRAGKAFSEEGFADMSNERSSRDLTIPNGSGAIVTERSVRPEEYGRFLIEIFDEWVRRDVGTTFVQFFDGVLAAWLLGQSSLCVLRSECGEALALEHNGDVYSCDHFVEPAHRLGNLLRTPLGELAASRRQREFGRAKSATLPRACRECEFLFACHGECPKNRVRKTADGEAGLNWLCAGLKAFFAHTREPMRMMADLLRAGQEARGVMAMLARQEGRLPGGASPSAPGLRSPRDKLPAPQTTAPRPQTRPPGRNDPCPCGSGLKFKKCHGRG